MKIVLIIFLLAHMTLATLTAGGPWPQPKGALFYKLGYSTISADQHFGENGNIMLNPEMKISSIFMYGEYGITDRLTAILSFPFLTTNNFSESKISSLGDTDVNLSYNVLNKGLNLSIGLTAGLPLGKSSGTIFPLQQTGDGEFNQIIFSEFGSGFKIGQQNMYFIGRLGYNNRATNFSDELQAGLKLGLTFLNERLGISLAINSVSPLQNEASHPINPVSLYGNRVKYIGFTPELYYKFSDILGLVVSMGGATKSSEYILARPMLSVGVFGKFSKSTKK